MSDNNIEKFQIRNSTVDFLVFTKDAHEEGIEVRVQDGYLVDAESYWTAI